MRDAYKICYALFITCYLGGRYGILAQSSVSYSHSTGIEYLQPLGEGTLKLLWLTPVLVQPLPEPLAFASELAHRTTALFEAFATNATRGHGAAGIALRQVVQGSASDSSESWNNDADSYNFHGRLEPHHMNDAFYAWQRAVGSSTMEAALGANLKRLKEHMIRVFAKARAAVGISAELEAESKLFCWTSVHDSRRGSTHPPHTHATAALSAVYYATAPANAGPLLLHDPRGPRPPFDHTYAVHPRVNELVVFPSWLVHEVRGGSNSGYQVSETLSTDGPADRRRDSSSEQINTEMRVSFSCNSPGPWTESSDLSIGYPA